MLQERSRWTLNALNSPNPNLGNKGMKEPRAKLPAHSLDLFKDKFALCTRRRFVATYLLRR